MNPRVLNEIFERASVSGDPEIRTLASAILEYRIIIDNLVEDLVDIAHKLEIGEPWQGHRCRGIAKYLRDYGTISSDKMEEI